MFTTSSEVTSVNIQTTSQSLFPPSSTQILRQKIAQRFSLSQRKNSRYFLNYKRQDGIIKRSSIESQQNCLLCTSLISNAFVVLSHHFPCKSTIAFQKLFVREGSPCHSCNTLETFESNGHDSGWEWSGCGHVHESREHFLSHQSLLPRKTICGFCSALKTFCEQQSQSRSRAAVVVHAALSTTLSMVSISVVKSSSLGVK